MEPRTKPFTIYHWDTFDNETFEIAAAETLDEARAFVAQRYGDRVRQDGADRVDIVDLAGNVLESFRVR